MTPDLDQAALTAQLESLASRWQRDADDHLQTATLSDDTRYRQGYAEALIRCSQAVKGLLAQWQ